MIAFGYRCHEQNLPCNECLASPLVKSAKCIRQSLVMIPGLNDYGQD